MEEIYIVKLKGLPPPTGTSHESLSKDSKTSFYYHTDLTAEAIRGFSFLHIFFGLTVLCLSVTNLCFHENPLALEPPLGITIWCAIAFIALGLFGMVTAYKRKCDLSRSIFYVKIHFMIIIVVLSMTLTFVILFAFDLHGPIANQFIGLNIFFSIIVETVILLLTLFTCARVLWPGCINFCAKDWPMQPKLKRKVIVKTNVFANGIQQDESSMIQSVGPNCIISLNMPPLSSESSPHSTQPSTPSSICAKEMSNLALTSDISSATSDLANSSSSLYSVNGDQNNSAEERNPDLDQSSIIRSLFHNGISLTNSYPLSGRNMQTFPNDPNNRSSQTTSYSNNRLLYQHSHLFKRRSYLESSCSFNREYSNRIERDQRSDLEEIDPYDTDEFDYCSTDEDDELNNRPTEPALTCNNSSTDDGKSTLEEGNKSSTNSDKFSSSHNENDLNNHEIHFNRMSISDSETDLRYQSVALEKNNILVKFDSRDVTHEQSNKTPSEPEYSELAESAERENMSDDRVVIDSDERLSLHGSEENDDDRDEGISSSGSSTCSGELTQPLSTHFTNRLRLQTYSSKQPYKSSIKIESHNISLPIASSTNSINQSCTSKSDSSTEDTSPTNSQLATPNNNLSKIESTTTIRLLTTKSVPNQPKQKLRIDLGCDKTEETSVPSGAVNKLASHPYLCRLRASNVDCFERRYPKYSTTLPSSSSSTSTSSTSTSTSTSSSPSSNTMNRSRSNLTINYHEQNRIPDIQRV